MNDRDFDWPDLTLDSWQGTYESLHLWSQVVGKIRLARMPWINHSWHVPLYVTARGLTTSLIPYGAGGFEVEFDFVRHRLRIATSEGGERLIPLRDMSVADFFAQVMQSLDELDIQVDIWPMPVEMPGEVLPFPEDDAPRPYDAASAERFRRALLHIHRVFTDFRAAFVGKVSPVHFFWGAFDLAVTRFSGRPAPKHPGGAPKMADWIMQEAYSHEVSSAGFWPGAGLGEAAFYSYAYPEPEGFKESAVRPGEAYYHDEMGEFILPYEAVRAASEPEEVLMAFLQSTYLAAADRGAWDRVALEREAPVA